LAAIEAWLQQQPAGEAANKWLTVEFHRHGYACCGAARQVPGKHAPAASAAFAIACGAFALAGDDDAQAHGHPEYCNYAQQARKLARVARREPEAVEEARPPGPDIPEEDLPEVVLPAMTWIPAEFERQAETSARAVLAAHAIPVGDVQFDLANEDQLSDQAGQPGIQSLRVLIQAEPAAVFGNIGCRRGCAEELAGQLRLLAARAFLANHTVLYVCFKDVSATHPGYVCWECCLMFHHGR
jgi:hypothetical protein